MPTSALLTGQLTRNASDTRSTRVAQGQRWRAEQEDAAQNCDDHPSWFSGRDLDREAERLFRGLSGEGLNPQPAP